MDAELGARFWSISKSFIKREEARTACPNFSRMKQNRFYGIIVWRVFIFGRAPAAGNIAFPQQNIYRLQGRVCSGVPYQPAAGTKPSTPLALAYHLMGSPSEVCFHPSETSSNN